MLYTCMRNLEIEHVIWREVLCGGVERASDAGLSFTGSPFVQRYGGIVAVVLSPRYQFVLRYLSNHTSKLTGHRPAQLY